MARSRACGVQEMAWHGPPPRSHRLAAAAASCRADWRGLERNCSGLDWTGPDWTGCSAVRLQCRFALSLSRLFGGEIPTIVQSVVTSPSECCRRAGRGRGEGLAVKREGVSEEGMGERGVGRGDDGEGERGGESNWQDYCGRLAPRAPYQSIEKQYSTDPPHLKDITPKNAAHSTAIY